MTYLPHIALLKYALNVVAIRTIGLAQVFGQRDQSGGWHALHCISNRLLYNQDGLTPFHDASFAQHFRSLATSAVWARDQAGAILAVK